MFDIGGEEALLLIILGLLFFGPRRLPEIGKQLGGFVAQLRNAMRDFQGNLEREVELEELKKAAREFKEMKEQAAATARQLTGYGPPPYADPSRPTPQVTVPAESVPVGAPEPPPEPPVETTQAELDFGSPAEPAAAPAETHDPPAEKPAEKA